MNKKELLKMKKLTPTPYMVRRAGTDVPEKIKPYSCSKETVDRCKTEFYLRCCTKDKTIKVSVFKTTYIRAGSKEPIADIYLDVENDDFITFDNIHQKWSNAMVSNLDLLRRGYWSVRFERTHSSRDTNKKIKTFLGVSESGLDGILAFQQRVRERQLIQRHQRETDPWDKVQELVPALPKDWIEWVRRTAITDHYMIYSYSKKVETGYCSRCNQYVPVKNPKYNHQGKCSKCGATVTYKSTGKSGSFSSRPEYAYLIQRTSAGFVIREFNVSGFYNSNNLCNPEFYAFEKRRVFYDEQFNPQTYYYGLYKNCETRWIKTGNLESFWSPQDGAVYGKTLPALENAELKYTGLPNVVRGIGRIDPEVYLQGLQKEKCVEQVAKAGLTQYAYDLAVGKAHWSFVETPKIENSGELHKRLGISKENMRIMRDYNLGINHLIWLIYSQERKRAISISTIKWFVERRIYPDDIKFITDRMTENAICNYLKKQLGLSKDTPNALLNIWDDYLVMAKRLKHNVTMSCVYAPKFLVNKHNELVKILGNADAAKTADNILKMFPQVDNICASLKGKYDYADETYSVIVPERVEDIINDSRELQHCISSTPERYFGRIDNHESYILFLRKTDDPEKPFYTLEVEPNGTVRQTRTKFNKQGNDIGDIKAFLVKWQKTISERLSGDDIDKGAVSNDARISEYKELRSQKVLVRGGDLRGKMLADVLEADLLLNKFALSTVGKVV